MFPACNPHGTRERGAVRSEKECKMARWTKMALPLALVALAAPALADTSKSVKVDYSDLDLSTPAGQKKFASRVMTASRAVCDTLRTGSRIISPEMKKCQDDAKVSAKQQIEETIARYTDGTKVVAGN